MTPAIEQLSQFVHGPVWDGNLIGKGERDRLVEAGFVERVSGWNFLSSQGVALCVTLRLLAADGPFDPKRSIRDYMA